MKQVTRVPMPDGYELISSTDLAKEAGATFRQIDHWTRNGYLRAVHKGGSGNPRRFRRHEIDIATALRQISPVVDALNAGAIMRLVADTSRSGESTVQIGECALSWGRREEGDAVHSDEGRGSHVP